MSAQDQTWMVERLKTAFLLALGVLFLLVLYRTAWLCDDAFITYRSVDNFLNGHGLTFNPGERVQAFTHPLWALLHIPAYGLIGDIYATGLLVAMLVTVAAMLLLAGRIADRPAAIALVLLTAIASKAFMDYATSGLENPLTHLLLGIFALRFLDREESRRNLFWLALIAGLGIWNRMDTALLFGPALFLTWWRQRSFRTALTVAAGLLPFLLWEVIAFVYYGFPFPNSAYAKLTVGFSGNELLLNGLHYFVNSLRNDPVTLLTIFTGLTLPFVLRQARHKALAIGGLLYLLYILYIGGDFMSGRFFAAPFFLALILIARSDVRWPLWAGLAPFMLGFLSVGPPVLSGADYGKKETTADKAQVDLIDEHGIADERAFYYPGTGLLAAAGREMPAFRWVEEGKRRRAAGERLLVANNMGFLGFYGGPDLHLIDNYALANPFLARLPNVYQPDWRPGHYQRLIPRGYVNTVAMDSLQLKDPALHPLYEAIRAVTKGPIWSSDRWAAIWRLNFGDGYAEGIDKAGYHMPVSSRRSIADMAFPGGAQRPWNAPAHSIVHQDAGLQVDLLPDDGGDDFNFWVRSQCEMVLLFRKGDEVVKGHLLSGKRAQTPMRAVALRHPGVPIDNIVLYPNTWWCPCSVGAIERGRVAPKD